MNSVNQAFVNLLQMGRSSVWARLLFRYRIWVNLGIHVALFSLSALAAYAMLSESLEGMRNEPSPLTALMLLLAIRVVVFWRYDLFHGLWRYASFPDLLNIIRASCVSSLLFSLIGIFWHAVRMPERMYVLDLVFCIMLTGGVRLLTRNLRESAYPSGHFAQMKRVLLVGPLEKVQPLVKEMLSDQSGRFVPMAILDPTQELGNGGLRVSDVPVFSLGHALSDRRLRGLHGVVLCWPEASRRELDEVVEALKPLKVPFQTVPRVDDVLSGKVSVSDIRDVEIGDLLERPPVQTDLENIRSRLQGRVVLVTGGGGSIGSELCRQIASFGPGKLVIVERSESSLYDLREELAKKFPSLPLFASISSINDYPGLLALMRETRVELVFHAAAYKHVPLMEIAPIESAYNNVLGTYNVARAAAQCGVDRFVMISTDKAVNPTNVMGVTKRIAEMIVQAWNSHAGTRFMIVRFGNVLGSAGSVIPIFKRQIADGGPVTVTHPDMERYFMTISEAVQLILQASCIGEGGEVFVLDMGKPVKILHLAEKLISLSGKRPYEDIEIVFTQVRPGEKLFEELFDEKETPVKTLHPRILMAKSGPVDAQWMSKKVDEISEMIASRNLEGLRSLFKELVPTYTDSSAGEEGKGKGSAMPIVSGRSRGLAAASRS